MTHRVLSAVEALQLGLTQEVRHGASCAKQRAQHVAYAQTASPRMLLMLADPGILAREAIGHAECRVINHGEAKSTPHYATAVISHDMRWSEQREAPRGSVQQVQPLLILDCGGQFDTTQQRALLNTMHAAHVQLAPQEMVSCGSAKGCEGGHMMSTFAQFATPAGADLKTWMLGSTQDAPETFFC